MTNKDDDDDDNNKDGGRTGAFWVHSTTLEFVVKFGELVDDVSIMMLGFGMVDWWCNC